MNDTILSGVNAFGCPWASVGRYRAVRLPGGGTFFMVLDSSGAWYYGKADVPIAVRVQLADVLDAVASVQASAVPSGWASV